MRSSIYLRTVFWTSLSTLRCPLKFGFDLCFARIRLKSTELTRVTGINRNSKLTLDFGDADELTMMIAIRWKVIQNKFCQRGSILISETKFWDFETQIFYSLNFLFDSQILITSRIVTGPKTNKKLNRSQFVANSLFERGFLQTSIFEFNLQEV